MPTPAPPPFRISGRVASGLGRGAEFLQITWVLEELRRKLGLIPFPGTLNLRIDPSARESLFERRDSFARIADPDDPSCSGYLHPVILRANDLACASSYLILPELSMYKDVLEVIAADNLRQKLALKDGDAVEIEEVLS